MQAKRKVFEMLPKFMGQLKGALFQTDATGKLEALRGTAEGQTLSWNHSLLRWEAKAGSGGNANAAVVTVTANTLLTNEHGVIRVDASSGPVTITLPEPAVEQITALVFNIKKVDTSENTVTIVAAVPQLIDGQASIALTRPYANVTLLAHSGGWDIL